jgi:hypothetical protein
MAVLAMRMMSHVDAPSDATIAVPQSTWVTREPGLSVTLPTSLRLLGPGENGTRWAPFWGGQCQQVIANLANLGVQVGWERCFR